MSMPSPQVDSRDLDAILRQMRALAPFYVPEWDAADETGAGAVLLKSFGRLLDGLIRRLNEVPQKNFVAFLNMLGVGLLPAQPARAPLTFFLSAGAQGAVPIPQRSQAAATPPGSEPVVFETERAILATPANLRAIFSVAPARDQIFDHGPDLLAGTTSELFGDERKNLQEHSLYLAHSELFALKDRATITIELAVSGPGFSAADFASALSWEWWNGSNWVPSIVSVYRQVLTDRAATVQQPAAGPAVTTLASDLAAGINGASASLTVTTDVASDARFPAAGLLLVDDEIIWYEKKQGNTFTGLTRGFSTGSTAPRPIVGASSAALHKAGTQVWAIDEPLRVGAAGTASGGQQQVTVTLEKVLAIPFVKASVNGVKTFWLRCRAPGNIQGSPLQNLSIDTIQASSGVPPTAAVRPDALFRNDVPLDLPTTQSPIYPFGVQPRVPDTFYIASGDAFSKKGASVTLSCSVTPGAIGSVPVRLVQGIGPTFASRLAEQEIEMVDELLEQSPEQLADLLQIHPTRALNILEAAQKAFYDKTGIIRPIAGVPPSPPPAAAAAGAAAAAQEALALSWEYWDGSGWQIIKALNDNTNKLRQPNEITFRCPDDIAPVAVGGQENYWIRVRLAAGDYGREEFSIVSNVVHVDTTKIKPPVMTSLGISYAFGAPKPLEQLLSYNNLDFVDRTATARVAALLFPAFPGLDADQQSLYLGFDAAPLKGPISVFFSLVEQEYTEKSRPRVGWQYLRASQAEPQGAWAQLLTTDGTRSLTASGTAEFIGPPDFVRAARLGQSLFWVRAVDLTSAFQPRAARSADPVPALANSLIGARVIRRSLREAVPAPSPCPDIRPCDEAIETFHPQFSVPRALLDKPAAPLLRGVYLNTAWAIQAETISNEILGSSAGNAGQQYALAKFPVVEESIWVNELRALTESERKTLAGSADLAVLEVKDEQGNLTEFWVRWSAVDDLTAAARGDRVYAIDRTFGQVRFGDGVQGIVPPIGRDNIRATYQAGGGSAGNLAAGLITALRTTIPYVERVANPEPAGGGADTETLSSALERGPQMIKHRGRAITREDFEWLARESSRAVARVRCLPTFNDRGESETNWVTVIVVPASGDPRPTPSPLLRQQVEQYLRARAANLTVFPEHVQVTGPIYVRVDVAAALFPVTIDRAPQVEADALRHIAEFLHPLTGGYSGVGWEFGRLPCLSDFYQLIEDIEGVDHVENLSMTLTAVTPTGEPIGEPRLASEDRPLSASMPEYALVFSGTHSFTLKTLG
jgi:hypothetical protein